MSLPFVMPIFGAAPDQVVDSEDFDVVLNAAFAEVTGSIATLQANTTTSLLELYGIAEDLQTDVSVSAQNGGGTATRPGEQPKAFGAGSTGAPLSLPDVVAEGGAEVEVVDGLGSVLIVENRALGVTHRNAQAVHPGRVYRADAYVRRLVNPADPAGSTVQFSLSVMDSDYGVVSAVEMDAGVLRASDGLAHYTATFAITPGLAGVDHLISAGAVFARAVFLVFGADHKTAIADLRITDITEAAQIDGALDVGALASALEDAEAAAVAAAGDRAIAALAAITAETFGPRTKNSYAALIADTVLTPANTPPPSTVSVPGLADYLVTLADEDLETAGGVLLNVLATGPVYNAQAFGMLGNGSDCADAFERACTRVDTSGGGTLYFPPGIYVFERSVFAQISVSLLGASPLFTRGTTASPIENAGTVFRPKAGGTYVGDFVFYLNVNPAAPTTWVRWYTANGPSVRRITFDALGIDVGFNAFKFGGTYAFEDLRNRGCATFIAKPNLYTDGVSIRSIQSQQRRNTTDWLIDLPGLGDKLAIADVASGYTGDEVGTTKGVRVEQCRGGIVQGLVNGHHEFALCQGMPIFAAHIEGGSITIDRCDTPVFGNFLYRTSNGDGQIIVKGNILNRTMPSIRDNVFQTILGWAPGPLMTTETPDIVFNDTYAAAMLSGNTRSYTVNGVLSRKASFGVKIGLPTVGLDNAFNRFSAHLSTQEVTVTGAGGAVLAHKIADHALAFGGLGVAAASNVNGNDFALGAGTYYYQAQVIIDPVRMIGRTVANAERSVTVGATDQLPTFSLEFSSTVRRSNICVRVYRGTSAGSYTSYCDLHVLAVGELVDDGATLSGQPWLARTAGPIDTLNSNGMSGYAELLGANIQIDTTAAVPSVGAWIAGDEVRKTNVGTGQFANSVWRRLTSGSGWVEGTDFVIERVWVNGASGVVPARRLAGPPATAGATGAIGDYYADANWFYVCTAANTWVRAAVATW